MSSIRSSYGKLVGIYLAVTATAVILIGTSASWLIDQSLRSIVSQEVQNLSQRVFGELRETDAFTTRQLSVSSFLAINFEQNGSKTDSRYAEIARPSLNSFAHSLYGVTDRIGYFAVVHQDGHFLAEFNNLEETPVSHLSSTSDRDFLEKIRAGKPFIGKAALGSMLYVVKESVHSKESTKRGSHFVVVGLRTLPTRGFQQALAVELAERVPLFSHSLSDEYLPFCVRLEGVDAQDETGCIELSRQAKKIEYFSGKQKVVGVQLVVGMDSHIFRWYSFFSAGFLAGTILIPMLIFVLLLLRTTNSVVLEVSRIHTKIADLRKDNKEPHEIAFDAESKFSEIQDIVDGVKDLLGEIKQSAVRTKMLERNAAIAQMTQMLAHDVRRPFSMLKMLLEGISKARTPSEMQLFASKGVPETARAMNSVNGLIEDVMEVGSSSEMLLSPAKPESLLEAALGEVCQSLPSASISISYELKHTTHANVESGKVLRVFANIFGNAIEAMKKNGAMRIATSNIDEDGCAYVKFVLGNDGPPIPSELIPRLFDAFFTSGKKGGTGLGLAIAQKIVTAHGGKIWCESSVDIGVEFHLTLPAIGPNLVPDAGTLPRTSQEVAARFKSFGGVGLDDDSEVRLEMSLRNLLPDLGRRLSVLIVDDESIYRSSLAESLGRHQELADLLEIVSADCSDDALALPCPDLAIVDVDLGPISISGFDLVQEMRRRGQTGFICIHSNRISASDNKTAIAQGADAFLPKPMSRAHLLKLLCQALERLGLVDPTLSSSNPGGTIVSSENKPAEASRKDEDSMVSVFVDDVATIRMSWEIDWPIGKLITFASPEKFWTHVDANAGFLDSLTCIVTDLNFGGLSAIDGHEFARQLKQRTQLPIFVASNSSVKVEDFGGTVDGVLEKSPPNRATLENFLFKK